MEVHNWLATYYLSTSFKIQKHPKADELTVTALCLLSNLGKGIFQELRKVKLAAFALGRRWAGRAIAATALLAFSLQLGNNSNSQCGFQGLSPGNFAASGSLQLQATLPMPRTSRALNYTCTYCLSVHKHAHTAYT